MVCTILQERLLHEDFSKFQPLKPRLIQNVDKMLAEDIARLMAMIPLEEKQNMQPKGQSFLREKRQSMQQSSGGSNSVTG